MELKNRLKELRRDKMVSAGDLAALTEKAESTVRTWETGKSFPDADTLVKLADHYDVSVDWLLGRSTYQNSEQVANYEWKLINSMHRGQIEQIKKRLIDICNDHHTDMGQSPLFIGWFFDALNKCTELFDQFLTEVQTGHSTGSGKHTFIEIIEVINKLGIDIAWHHESTPKSTETPSG